jgi:biotin carboxyl carrier protein
VLRIQINGEWREIDASELKVEPLAPDHFLVWDGDSAFEVFETDGKLSDGHSLDRADVHYESERERIVREHFVKAPMPGMIRAVHVSAGDIVERDATLVVLEAMKMENNILAGVSGRVTKVHASEGKSVDKNAVLVEIELG